MARVLLGISGGIAAYKTPQLVRDLRAQGHEVKVVLTRSAAHFVSKLSLATVSEHPVRSELFELTEEAQIGHIELARWPDVLLLAPATADLLARAALGRCDDLLSTILLATRAKIAIAPAMNVQMWAHPMTKAHVATLQARGALIIAPQTGVLACGETGVGKLADLGAIVSAVSMATRRDWAGQRVLVTAGPTREALDGVRFISNGSTGTMGFALACAAAQRGASVELVAGPVSLSTPAGVVRHNVQSAQEMYNCAQGLLQDQGADWVFKVAAVADLYLPKAVSQKQSKDKWLGAPLQLSPTPDILAKLVAQFGSKTRFLGFAAQTAQDEANADQSIIALAKAKLARKGCDAIFVNRVGVAQTGFGSGTNGGFLLQAGKDEALSIAHASPVPKEELAHRILDALVSLGASA